MKPVVIVYGMNLIRLPKWHNPIIIRKIPARMVEIMRPSIPFLATMVANAAVGPAICTLLPPRAEITNSATIAVKIPASGPTPEARANAMDSGSAIIATIMPAVQLTL